MKQLIIITSIVFIAAVLLSAIFLAGVDINRTMDKVTFNESYSFTDVKVIDLSAVSTNIIVEKTTLNEVTLIHTGSCMYGRLGRSKDLVEVVPFEAKINNGKVKGKTYENRFYPFTYFVDCNDKLLVSVPESFTGDLAIETVSSNVKINSNNLENLKINIVSGNVLFDAFAKNVDVETISGNIVIKSGDNIDADSVSGDITIGQLTSGMISTISGNVYLDITESQSIAFESVSGEIKGSGKVSSDASIRIDTVSGDAILK